MTTELLGREMAQADGYVRPSEESPLAQPIRESAARVARRAIGREGLRWVEAFVRLELGLDPDDIVVSMPPLQLDQYVGRALGAVDAVTISECEALAQRYGL